MPLRIPELVPETVLLAVESDKKQRGGQLRFVLPSRAGKVFVAGEIDKASVLATIEALCVGVQHSRQMTSGGEGRE